jgi:hypothetical protein
VNATGKTRGPFSASTALRHRRVDYQGLPSGVRIPHGEAGYSSQVVTRVGTRHELTAEPNRNENEDGPNCGTTLQPLISLSDRTPDTIRMQWAVHGLASCSDI